MKLGVQSYALGTFLFACSLTLNAQNPAVTVSVDVQANRHRINPLIYGVELFENPNTTSMLQDLNCPLNRYGGNRASTYNWNLNSDNKANDYFFESISDDVRVAGERGDTFITVTKNAAAEPMVTLPMLDWIAKAGTAQPYPCSYPRTKFPNQFAFDPFNTNCGDGLMPDGKTLINGADPNDAYVTNTLAIQQSWIQHIIGKFNTAVNGGLKYYILDNEHDLWWGTHHDVVPNNPHYDQDRDRMFLYASAIKSLDPNALIVGPEPSGWLGYKLSPADFQYGELNGYANVDNFPDRKAINGIDYIPWLLAQFRQYETNNNKRILDVLTVHYYPKGGPNNVNTRSLWDPNYVDPSYINDKISLIPRMKKWVADNYPTTGIGITEYNWGYINDEAAHDNIGYAVTQADVLGIFGREGLDLAIRFYAPPPNLPTYNAMKMYRNYDGKKSTFGDVSTLATVPNPDNLAAFSAQRTSDGKLTVMLLNKYATGSTPTTVNLANFAYTGPAQVWQLSDPGTTIQHPADVTVNNSIVSLVLPPQSITLLVIPAGVNGPDLTISKTHSGNFTVGANGVYTLTVSNVGSAASSGTITVTDNLSAGLSFVSASGIGWSCSASGQNVTCTNPGPVAAGASSSITLTVAVDAAAIPSVINIASVSNQSDINPANNTASDAATVNGIQRPSSTAIVSPFVFSPNGDGFKDTLAIQFTLSVSDSITVDILDRNGSSVATLLNGSSLVAGTYVVTWDGLTASGAVANDGMYTFRIRGNTTATIVGALGLNNAIPEVSKSWFLAEGSTVGFQAYILIQNPNDLAITANVTFFNQDGTTKLYSELVSPRTRTTVAIHDPIKGVPNTYSVSSSVTATLPIIVERAMYFNNNAGGHDTIGSIATTKTWYFAGNHTFPGDEDFILIVNPSSSSGTTVTATFFFENQSPLVQTYSVGATSRFTIPVHGIAPGTRVSVSLNSTLPIAAERAFYINNRAGGSSDIGAPSPSLSWYFAEGDTSALTSPASATTLLELLNPGAASANVTVNYMLENGSLIAKSYTMPGQRRLSIDAASQIGAGQRFSMEVLSDNPIVAERLMFSGTDVGDSIGSPTTGYVWNLAEGFTAFGYETWVVVSNPGTQTANVTARFLKQNGQNIFANYTLPAKHRLTIYVNTSIDEQTSVSTQVTSDQPIVVERTMKFANRQGIHQSMGVRQ